MKWEKVGLLMFITGTALRGSSNFYEQMVSWIFYIVGGMMYLICEEKYNAGTN